MRFFGLNEAEPEEKEQKVIEKTFNYEEDMDELGKRLDKQNRKKYPKEECDSVFIAGTEIIEDINKLKNEEECNFDMRIDQIKKEALQEEMLFASEEFDIFGTITEDKTKINSIRKCKT